MLSSNKKLTVRDFSKFFFKSMLFCEVSSNRKKSIGVFLEYGILITKYYHSFFETFELLEIDKTKHLCASSISYSKF